MLAIIDVRQVRGACLPVINGTEVGSSGLVVGIQASDITLVMIVLIVRVCHLILAVSKCTLK